MALYRRLLHSQSEIKILVNGFKTSCSSWIDLRWRFENGLTENPNTFGPLTNLPDYSFKDGRPTPLGVKQKIRVNKNREYAAKIVKLVGEVDHAVERNAKKIEKKEKEKQRILSEKLKPKGQLLLKQKRDL